MQKIPLKLNLCQTIQSATLEHPRPSSYAPALYINTVKHELLKSDFFLFFFISTKYQQKTHTVRLFYIDLF